ncbi:TonB-dependent receptor [Brevundimonas lenta]|uniref:Iron complex outermembrane receptor protein n=1 Tax=Brevundimonas lenta TaxID=424796 RepID=A0A7W6JAS8_9CAUL|nr:TonB-dependent receptor [Brevundimonas lenta]MBB4081671.1 iron complex outermembrane receptor protein [Brevundimonas lenta]
MTVSAVSRAALTAALGWTALAGVAMAQEAPAQDATELQEVVVTGVPYGVTRRATTIATTVVDAETLAQAPAASLGDLVNGLPGVRSTDFAPGASRPVIRGLSGPRVQVLTNGIGLIDASSVSPDHQVATDPAEANRIEIVRGPATLAYGGTAIGGVVNVLDDRIPDALPDGGVDGLVSTQASSVDDGWSASGRATVALGPVAINIEGVKKDASDYDIPSPAISQRLADAEGIDRGPGGTQPNSFSQLESWGVGASWIGSDGYIGAAYKDLSSSYGVVAEPEVYIELKQTREDVRGEWRLDNGPLQAIRGAFGHAQYEHTEFEGPGEPGTIFNSDGQEGRIDLVQRARDGWNGAVGFQALSRTFEAIGDEAFVPSSDVEEIGAYTVQRLDREHWGLEGGLRYDRRSVAATPLSGGSRLDLTFDNVSASAAVFLRPTHELFLGLGLAHNERAPSEVELFADGLHIATGVYETGDPTLDNETVNTIEGSVHYDSGRFRGDLHVYASRYDGFIDERDTGTEFIDDGEAFPVFQFVQTNADFHGFEAEAEYDLWSSGDRSLSIEGAADYVRAQTDLGPAARIPPYSITGRLVWTSTPFDAKLELRHVGEQDRLADNELGTDSYTMLNLSGAWRPFSDRNVSVFAEGHNLTDEEAREHVSFLKDVAPLPGRNFRVGVSYRF